MKSIYDDPRFVELLNKDEYMRIAKYILTTVRNISKEAIQECFIQIIDRACDRGYIIKAAQVANLFNEPVRTEQLIKIINTTYSYDERCGALSDITDSFYEVLEVALFLSEPAKIDQLLKLRRAFIAGTYPDHAWEVDCLLPEKHRLGEAEIADTLDYFISRDDCYGVWLDNAALIPMLERLSGEMRTKYVTTIAHLFTDKETTGDFLLLLNTDQNTPEALAARSRQVYDKIVLATESDLE